MEIESACPHCTRPFVRQFKKPRCAECESRRRDDYAEACRSGSYAAYNEKWSIRTKDHPVRALLDGAVPIGGAVFFFNGHPYIPKMKVDEVRALLG